MRILIGLFLASAMLAAPAVSGAQEHTNRWVSTALGGSFGGQTHHSSPSVGVSAGMSFTKWIRVEGEATDAPEFYAQDGFLTDRRVSTFMGYGLVPILRHDTGRLHPYVTGGLGVIRSHLSEAGGLTSVTANKLGLAVGAGATADLTKTIGLRGDVRYLRGTHASAADTNAFGVDFSTLGFWRVSGGMVVRY